MSKSSLKENFSCPQENDEEVFIKETSLTKNPLKNSPRTCKCRSISSYGEEDTTKESLRVQTYQCAETRKISRQHSKSSSGSNQVSSQTNSKIIRSKESDLSEEEETHSPSITPKKVKSSITGSQHTLITSDSSPEDINSNNVTSANSCLTEELTEVNEPPTIRSVTNSQGTNSSSKKLKSENSLIKTKEEELKAQNVVTNKLKSVDIRSENQIILDQYSDQTPSDYSGRQDDTRFSMLNRLGSNSTLKHRHLRLITGQESTFVSAYDMSSPSGQQQSNIDENQENNEVTIKSYKCLCSKGSCVMQESRFRKATEFTSDCNFEELMQDICPNNVSRSRMLEDVDLEINEQSDQKIVVVDVNENVQVEESPVKVGVNKSVPNMVNSLKLLKVPQSCCTCEDKNVGTSKVRIPEVTTQTSEINMRPKDSSQNKMMMDQDIGVNGFNVPAIADVGCQCEEYLQERLRICSRNCPQQKWQNCNPHKVHVNNQQRLSTNRNNYSQCLNKQIVKSSSPPEIRKTPTSSSSNQQGKIDQILSTPQNSLAEDTHDVEGKAMKEEPQSEMMSRQCEKYIQIKDSLMKRIVGTVRDLKSAMENLQKMQEHMNGSIVSENEDQQRKIGDESRGVTKKVKSTQRKKIR